jgi:hypothetical protein
VGETQTHRKGNGHGRDRPQQKHGTIGMSNGATCDMQKMCRVWKNDILMTVENTVIMRLRKMSHGTTQGESETNHPLPLTAAFESSSRFWFSCQFKTAMMNISTAMWMLLLFG